ncbi:LytR/AlgR family response regulator transcription factor [Pedobacter suwonensis]|uniref:LytR/AlgR family response regulator transcription factor n=1 Tax=Pedobacter suwonensis TaxID=332999 RepID=UPI003687C273
MNYIIIEDEPLAVERIQLFTKQIPFLKCMAVFEEAFNAVEFLSSNIVDLIFLDIHIGKISGIEFLEIARPDGQVIILSAFSEYALKGFELNVTDYLLKPFLFERFYHAVKRAKDIYDKKFDSKVIFIKSGYKLEKIFLSELLFIEGDRDYRIICTQSKSFKTPETFTDLERKLSPSRFIRVHKSYLIALDKIDFFQNDMLKIGGQLIPVSQSHKKALLSRLR